MAALVTVERAKKCPVLSVGVDDSLLGTLLSAASTAAERYCNRSFAEAERTEFYDGDGTPELLLRCFPVKTVATVTLIDDDGTETVVAMTEVRVDPGSGRLRFLRTSTHRAFPVGFLNVRVKYTAGFAAIPEDVQEAVVQAAAALNAIGESDPTVSGEKLGDYQYTAKDPAVSGDVAVQLPSVAKALLGPYRDRGV